MIEIQLWSHEELRRQGAVRPSWLDWLEDNTGVGRNERVRSVSMLIRRERKYTLMFRIVSASEGAEARR